MVRLCTSTVELYMVKTLEDIKELVQIERMAVACESKAFRFNINANYLIP
jgi:hypothetical protein